MTAIALDHRTGTVRPKIGRDGWIMRACMVVLGLFLAVAVLLPLYTMLSKSVEDREGTFIGLANYARYFGTPALFNSIYNSLTMAVITTVITILIAFIYAYAITRSRMPMRGLFK